ncbi:hypothetical protein O3G_MSEX004933 [Manduca sexta]|uniref:DUF4773 domain-containing protein n=1 Tax=Manduca sexta TaxID=7130 RepID=A0A921YXS8_MANSE|nr:hypothetical protein O3G_MSEX004933 [Manduca sexta]
MITSIKLCLVLVCVKLSNASVGNIVEREDRSYDVIDFKVPRVIWRQALSKPVLRSPVEIVLPIHVQQDDDDENEIDDEVDNVVTENVSVDATLVEGDPIVQTEQVTAAPVANVTSKPTLQNQPTTLQPEQDVNGQVMRFPCSCVRGQCGCCTGTILERFRMKACGNISFVPEDFVFDVKLNVNNNTVLRRRVSASDPPPICFNPRRAPFVRVCAEISNIRIRNRNAFACLDINADIAGFPVYSASFRCFGLGSSGVQTGLKPKPVSSGPTPVNLFGNSNNDDDGGLLGDAGGILGGGGDGLFGGGDGIFGGGNDEGPLDAIGDAVGDFFDGRKL